MNTYAQFKPTGNDPSGLALPNQQHWLVSPVSQTRDSGPLEASNFAAFLAALGWESDTVEVHRFSHWGAGWFELILLDPADEDRVQAAEELEGSLKSCPVLDEADFSRREREAFEATWESWGRDEYVKQCGRELWCNGLSPLHPDWSDDEILDAVRELDSETVDRIESDAGRGVGWEYESASDGVSINFKGLVEQTDLDDLIGEAAALLQSDETARDIKRLGAVLGASPELCRFAVMTGITLVSGFRHWLRIESTATVFYPRTNL